MTKLEELQKEYTAIICHTMINKAIEDMWQMKDQFEQVEVIQEKLNTALQALQYSAQTVYQLEGNSRRFRCKDYLKDCLERIKVEEEREAQEKADQDQGRLAI